MKPEEKDLLTTDVCSRIPYHLKVNYADKVYDVLGYTNNKLIIVLPFMSNLEGHPIETCKPYLRPMESMTEEEAAELDEMNIYNKPIAFYNRLGEEPHFYMECNVINVIEAMQYIDWLNKKMFDYRGLIPMGLALPAPEGMYNLN